MEKIKLGVSSCLLGERVRYDGSHRRSCHIVDTLGKNFEFVPICPEMAIGLGVPREPIQLCGSLAEPRVAGVSDPEMDVTKELHQMGWAVANDRRDISGYILKSGSPSCGMAGVNRYPLNSIKPVRDGVGQYAAALMSANPLLPIEEESRLNDPNVTENFITRVYQYHERLQVSR